MKAAWTRCCNCAGVSYDWRTTAEERKKPEHKTYRSVGVIAQEVEAVIPELVQTNEGGYKYMHYDGLAPLLIEAIKEQQTIINEKDAQIQSLEERLSKIEQMLSVNEVSGQNKRPSNKATR